MKIFEILQQYIFYPVEQLIELMKSSAISDYLFGGHINLFYVIITFVVGLMVVRFFLRPFTTGTVGSIINYHNRASVSESKAESLRQTNYSSNHGPYGTANNGNGKVF